MNFLRQATASQSRTIGPYISDTDFKTVQTGLTIANTDIKLMSNGGASASKNSGGGTHRQSGHYGVTFDATDTATVGELSVSSVVAGALPVFAKFYVLEEAVFDALFAASSPGYVVDQPVNVTKFGGTSVTGRDIGASVLLSNGTGTGQVKLAAGYVAMTWADIAAPTTAVNLSGTTIATTQKVDVDTIKTNPVVNAGTVTFPTGATLASTTNITGGTITTVTNLTNAPTSGDFTATMKASIGTAVAASEVASVTGNVGGNVLGSVASIATGGLTASSIASDAFTAAKFASDVGAEFADAVWDEAISGHLTGGTTGAALNAAGSAGDPWSTPLPGAYSSGTAGFIIGTNVDAKISDRLATSGYTAPLSAAGTRSALGMASADLDTQLDAIKADTAASKEYADNTVVRGTVTTGASTTSIPTSAFSPSGAAADQFKGRILVFDTDTATATLRGQATDITASSNSATPTLTVTALTHAPSSGDTFSVL